MRIVVIGGTGLIGKKLVPLLAAEEHDVIAASPSKGVDSVSGKGLAEALEGAGIVVDVSNSPSFDDDPVMQFFETSTKNLIEAARKSGVSHFVALSVVGTDRLQESGYFRAKLVQERLIAGSGIPYTIVRATQFFEFVGAIAASGRRDGEVHLPSQLFQPIVSDDVAAALKDFVLGTPANGIRDIAGPTAAPVADFARKWLRAQGDATPVHADADATYFGTPLEETSLVPIGEARLMTTRFDAWLEAAAVAHRPA